MAARGDMELVHTEEGTFNIWALEVGTGKSTSDLFHRITELRIVAYQLPIACLVMWMGMCPFN